MPRHAQLKTKGKNELTATCALREDFSSITTLCPPSFSKYADVKPAIPAPITIHLSWIEGSSIVFVEISRAIAEDDGRGVRRGIWINLTSSLCNDKLNSSIHCTARYLAWRNCLINRHQLFFHHFRSSRWYLNSSAARTHMRLVALTTDINVWQSNSDHCDLALLALNRSERHLYNPKSEGESHSGF